MEVQKIGYTKIILSQNSREFTNIVAMFSNTISDHTVKNIWQIQNSVLWERYNRQKDQMKSKTLSSTVNERQLFHGTYLANIDAICRESFDWRICGTNGGEYGQGSYFARDALYAHKCSPVGSLGTRTMFVARVLVGHFSNGNPTLRRPPQKYGSSETYDSCVDNVYNPSVFVVFEKQQAYPEFMVEYEERKTPCIVN
ncbi:PREDICTED: poly [ADP-ribose] polymerase 12-like [Nanorana parkeri]|uniref:poly [ADP-ribose] polymerase 12-like n=1 Tax=Nanorana parkeri TaxID=125878 RepID=UPI000854DD47|nr:PREDICTED: poly [ADP-ribose] polymerase 12-like [Nanorana parkeri]